MRFASLGSGSKGNSTLVESQDTCVMVDCGFGVKDICKRLLALGKTPEDLSAILVTHEHSDHWKGVVPLARKFSIPVYLTSGCLKSRDVDFGSANFNIIDSHTDFVVGDLNVTPVPVPHDAREPVQYVFTDGMVRLGILTDLGHYTPHVISVYSQCHGLLLEANYDEEMLAMGPYPRFLKDRVSGLFGHLSNRQALDLLKKLDLSYLQRLLLGHISDKNNDTNIISELLSTADLGGTAITFADQDVGSDWQELG